MVDKRQLTQGPEPSTQSEASRSNVPHEVERLCGPAFQSLLLEVNQELATVLQDYRNMPDSAQECLQRGQHINDLLTRAVQCAVKQQILQTELSAQAFTDELTGLYNRRGFLTLAEQQLKLANRACREFLLFFVDVDGLKKINDAFDHSAGDLALIRTAGVLIRTFRDSDILARLGGDEFAVLAIESSDHNKTAIMARLGENLESVGINESRYHLSLSVGAVRFAPGIAGSIAELMRLADQAMYEVKRGRGPARPGNHRAPRLNGESIEWNRVT
jgi:diguanylate cyclase (GGDEF)-like protein